MVTTLSTNHAKGHHLHPPIKEDAPEQNSGIDQQQLELKDSTVSTAMPETAAFLLWLRDHIYITKWGRRRRRREVAIA